MKRSNRIGILLGSLLLLSACANSHSPGVSPELKHSWEVNFNRGDAGAVAALYAADAQLLMSGQEPIKGVGAIRRALEGMMKTGVKVRIEAVSNVGAGDIAYVFGSYAVLQGDGGKELERGSYIEIWRFLGGAWRIVLDINASAAPTMTAQRGDLAYVALR